MSEPLKNPGDPSVFGSTVKGEKVGNFEEIVAEASDQEVMKEAAEETAAAEEVQAEAASEAEPTSEEPEAEESEGVKLVREATEMLRKQATEQAAPQAPDSAYMKGQLDALKEQITQMGRAQDQPEPEGGFDFSLLESPEVLAQFEAARDDPAAQARMFGVIAQKVFEAQGSQEIKSLRKDVGSLLQTMQQQAQVQYNQQVFRTGLEAAKGVGEVEAALVSQFEQNSELAHLDAHMKAGGRAEDYQPRSILGLWLMAKDPQTGQPNAVFAGSPTLMQAGVRHLADQLRRGASGNTGSISTTAAAAPVRGGSPSETKGDEATPEEQILGDILAAAKRKEGRAKAFRDS